MSFADLPKFDELENKKRYWPAKSGSHEEGLGKLRYLTPAHVADVVRSEVRTGERVCLNWEMTRLETPGTEPAQLKTNVSSFDDFTQVSIDFHANIRSCRYQTTKA